MDAAVALTLAASVGEVAQQAGIVAAALLAGGALLAPAGRARAGLALAALLLTPVVLVATIWQSEQLAPVRDRPALAVGGALALAVLVGLGAWLLRRRPALLPLAAVAAVPFRVPIELGGTTANLLVPLYLVIGAGVLAWAVPALARRRPAAGWEAMDPHDDEEDAARPGALEWLLAGFVALYAVQATYSADVDTALEQVVFFYVPFTLLFALLARVAWTPRLVTWCLGLLAGIALVLVGIGFVEYATRTLLLNPKVIASNQVEAYFRVNSLFFDPNIFGRFLVVVMLGVAAATVWARREGAALAGAAVLAVLWGGLLLTLSQSSFVGLLVGLAVLAGLRWGWRRTAPVSAGLVVAAAAFVALAPGALNLELDSTRALDRATSGRYDLIAGGAGLVADRPLLGFGAGSFSTEFRRAEDASSEQAVSASHTIPLTVAAEQGVAGLAVYLALLVAAFVRLLRNAARSPARAAIAAAFAALVAHTMLYAAFLEDPLTWALLGVGTALAAGGVAGRPGSAPSPAPGHVEEPAREPA